MPQGGGLGLPHLSSSRRRGSHPPRACRFSPPAVLTVHHGGLAVKDLASWACLPSVALWPHQPLQPAAAIQALATAFYSLTTSGPSLAGLAIKGSHLDFTPRPFLSSPALRRPDGLKNQSVRLYLPKLGRIFVISAML